MNLLNTLKTDFFLSLITMENELLIGNKKIIPDKGKSIIDYNWLFSPMITKDQKMKMINSEFNKFNFSVNTVTIEKKTNTLLFAVKDIKGRVDKTIELIKGELVNG